MKKFNLLKKIILLLTIFFFCINSILLIRDSHIIKQNTYKNIIMIKEIILPQLTILNESTYVINLDVFRIKSLNEEILRLLNQE